MIEKIIRATAKIISTEGLEAASTRAVCQAVGITAPTLYYYFKSKTELIEAVSNLAIDMHREQKRKFFTDDPYENLKIAWDDFINFSLNEPELHKAMIVGISQGRVSGSGLACFKDLLREFKKLDAQGRLYHPPLESTQMYLGSAQGITMLFMATPSNQSLPLISSSTRDTLINGLVKNTEVRTIF